MNYFPTQLEEIYQQLLSIKPRSYCKTRNFRDGAVTKIGPYISRGVLSTRQVYDFLLSTGVAWHDSEKLIQELAWRDYWQNIWLTQKDAINSDLKHPQKPVRSHQIPSAIVEASTGIEAIDEAIKDLYKTGYMHNHMRMYVASICCNVAKCHWLVPAKWLYSHLLDGDLASNQLSWQWVAGSFSNKKYYANQDNINKYFSSKQKHTFLDVEYKQFNNMEIPDILRSTQKLGGEVYLPQLEGQAVIEDRPSLIFNYYNLDSRWHNEEAFQRVFIIEPSKFKENLISPKCMEFALELSKNISGVKIFLGEFNELQNYIKTENIRYKEHPLNHNYFGLEEPREWLCEVSAPSSSFFSFWKKCKKELLKQ